MKFCIFVELGDSRSVKLNRATKDDMPDGRYNSYELLPCDFRSPEHLLNFMAFGRMVCATEGPCNSYFVLSREQLKTFLLEEIDL